MGEDKKRVCGTCAWWDKAIIRGEGLCHVSSPIMTEGTKRWPITAEYDWCRHHSFKAVWEDDSQVTTSEAHVKLREDSEYVQFLEQLRTGPPLEEEKEDDGLKGGELREAIDYDSGRRVSQDVIEAMREQLREARRLIIRARPGVYSEDHGSWYTRKDKWLEKQDDE